MQSKRCALKRKQAHCPSNTKAKHSRICLFAYQSLVVHFFLFLFTLVYNAPKFERFRWHEILSLVYTESLSFKTKQAELRIFTVLNQDPIYLIFVIFRKFNFWIPSCEMVKTVVTISPLCGFALLLYSLKCDWGNLNDKTYDFNHDKHLKISKLLSVPFID